MRKLTAGLAAVAAVAVIGIAATGMQPALAQSPATESAPCPYHDEAPMDLESMQKWMASPGHASWMSSPGHVRAHDELGAHMMGRAGMMPTTNMP